MTNCQAGPNGTRCHTCVLWDENARLRTAVDALRNVLGRTIETRIDPQTGKPYHYLNEERAKALALAGEVMG